MEKIGQGGFATIFKCKRLSDGSFNVLKHTGMSEAERQTVINECSLIKALNSEYIVGCEDVYDFDKKIWVFLELMDEDMSKIILNSSSQYSEDFCKYTLYCVAKGLQAMHRNNVLHRDIKSENILIRKETGEIKIADLGLSVFLTE